MKPKKRGADYKRDPSHDPHLPHTTQYRHRPDVQIPPEALAVIEQQWPEVIRTFQQYDKGAGMLMLYGAVRDACAAAKMPDSMAYLVRDYLLSKLNAAKVTTYTGSDDRRGDFETFKIKDQPYESRAQALANYLLESTVRVRNQHNGQTYQATAEHWPEHGWSFQIYDLSPETWGRAPSGIGDGPVIDQGFMAELQKRGWEFPEMQEPKNVRNQEMQRLAGDLFARDNPPNPS